MSTNARLLGGYWSINGQTEPQRRMNQQPELEQHSNIQSDLTKQKSNSTELICAEMDERSWV